MTIHSYYFLFTIISCIIIGALSFKGADYGGIDEVSMESSKCLVGQYNVSFISILGSSMGSLNTNSVCVSLQNSQNSGISSRDVSLFPCPNCDTTAKQLSDLNSYLTTNCPDAWTGRIWILLTNYEYWGTPWRDVGYNKNRNIMNQFVDECLKQNLDCGVFTTSQQWGYIFGTDLPQPYTYPADSGLPLWVYPGNADENFDTYSKFGNWETPYAKQQVAGSYYTATCGLTYLGQDWAPYIE